MPAPHFPPHPAIRDLPYPERVVKLGRALVALSHDLALCRREVAELERENRRLTEELHRDRP